MPKATVATTTRAWPRMNRSWLLRAGGGVEPGVVGNGAHAAVAQQGGNGLRVLAR